MSTTSREANNAAILLIQQGRHEEARDLLRQALEMRVRENNNHNNPQEQPHARRGVALLQQSLLRCVTPDNHPTTNVVESSSSSSERNNNDSIPSSSSSTDNHDDAGDNNAEEDVAHHHHQAAAQASLSSLLLLARQQHHPPQPPPAPPQPLVYNHNNIGLLNVPFEINDRTVAADTAVIVYNMALSFHLQQQQQQGSSSGDNESNKARLFYQVSAILQLVRGIYLPLLDYITMHNLRVWHAAQGNPVAHQLFELSMCVARWNNLLEVNLVDAMLVNLQVTTTQTTTAAAAAALKRESNDKDNGEHV